MQNIKFARYKNGEIKNTLSNKTLFYGYSISTLRSFMHSNSYKNKNRYDAINSHFIDIIAKDFEKRKKEEVSLED